MTSDREIAPHAKLPMRFIDLFAGIGGMRLAFQAHGWECVFSSEWDSQAQRTYLANHGDTPHGDITQIQAREIPDFELLSAGFPCQPFSSMGKRQGFLHETQGTLFYDVLRIISEKQPKTFLLENVKGLVNHDKGNTFRVIQESLRDAGYSVNARVLNASDFGVPQSRERIYIVGHRKDLVQQAKAFEWPEPNFLSNAIGPHIEKNVGVGSISTGLQASYVFKKDDGRPQIVSPESTFPVKTLVASYHKIQRLSGTFVADGPTGLRLLSESECKSIMGFPKEFVFPVSRTQMYRQLGNSVAVPVVQAIASKITLSLSE